MTRPALLIRLASYLVPSARREEWLKEWLAELHYAESQYAESGHPDEQGIAEQSLKSFAFAGGSFHDALWQQRDFWTLKRALRLVHSPAFCLVALSAVIVLIALTSGMLPGTRRALLPLPYRDSGRVVTIAQAGTMATRSGMAGEAVALWRSNSRTLESIATYRWESNQVASVSEDFFYVLGAKMSGGRPFPSDAFQACGARVSQCVVLSYDFWKSEHQPSSIDIDGLRFEVAAVTEPGFWFLSPDIAAWRVGVPSRKTDTGVVARLAPDVTSNEASAELGAILRHSGMSDWDSMVELTQINGRVRFVFELFGFVLVLAILIVLPTVHMRMPQWNPRAAGFFAAKTALVQCAILLAGIEFTRASSITMLGGTDGFTAISTWLFMIASMGGLAWSIADQRQRCRVCLRRLGMAAHVGCTGCLLLDWAGTELVCVEGHGMLHVPEMVACWQEPYRWTSLDESWQGLFERS